MRLSFWCYFRLFFACIAFINSLFEQNKSYVAIIVDIIKERKKRNMQRDGVKRIILGNGYQVKMSILIIGWDMPSDVNMTIHLQPKIWFYHYLFASRFVVSRAVQLHSVVLFRSTLCALVLVFGWCWGMGLVSHFSLSC